MVSLASYRSNNSSGGVFGFSDNDHPTINSTSSDDDELIVDHIQLVSDPEMTHKPIHTTWAIIFIKILYIGLGVSAYVVPQYCTLKACGEDSITLTLYIHGGMWFVLFSLDCLLARQHKESRLSGYLDFYRKTHTIRSLPFLINSCANAMMVILVKFLDSHCHPQKHDKCWLLTKVQYIQILIGLECLLALVFLFIYLMHTIKFNRRKDLPDVTRDELVTSFVNSHSSADVGFRNENYIDQVMEKQADMIRYLRQHAEALAKRNLSLTEEVNRMKGYRRDPGSFHGHI